MPIYEYHCQACSHYLEELQKFNDAPLLTCPNCGKPALERLVSHTSFQLKGGGYYATDFKTKPKPETPANDNASSPAATDKKEKKET